MELSNLSEAKRLKIKLSFKDKFAHFKENSLINIEKTSTESLDTFLVCQYGDNKKESDFILCNCTINTANYLNDLFLGMHNQNYQCMFVVENIETSNILVQSYIFRSITEYKTPIDIIVKDNILTDFKKDKLNKEFIFDKLGMPAIFCLNNKNSKKKKAQIDFIGDKFTLRAQNTTDGIIANRIDYLKRRSDALIDIFIAPQINFIEENHVHTINNELTQNIEQISSNSSYFQRWDAYNKLSQQLLDLESEDFGDVVYTDFSMHTDLDGFYYVFNINNEVDASFIGKDLYVSSDQKLLNEDKKNSYNFIDTNNINVGQIKEISKNKITTFLENSYSNNLIPNTGILKLNNAGDKYIIKRRIAAKDRMLQRMSPIPYIVSLIEQGVSSVNIHNSFSSHKAVTNELKKNFKHARNLNEEQIKALDLAINTPDIALIQGPPGTGKTTVIKAIVERFKEIFEYEEKKKKDLNDKYTLKSPKILISSFQNEAVDNAISSPSSGDIPAFRKVSARVNDTNREQYKKSLENWYSNLKEHIESNIQDKALQEFYNEQISLNDEFLSYKNSHHDLNKAIALIKRYLNYIGITYPQDLLSKANAIISLRSFNSIDDEIDDPIVSKIKNQRITRESFVDDGILNARRLLATLSIRDNIEPHIKDAIEAVCEDNFSDAIFKSYVDAVTILKKRFCKDEVRIKDNDTETINKCILDLSTTFSRHYTDTLTSNESKKSLLLSRFLTRLEQEYESIVKKYAITTAATCQTSLDLRDSKDKEYDLVIIDEAARANPLDLFIPMSMGRKIILVGDHKQLPHMLENDVINLIKDDPNFKDLDSIEKSLFERLFDMFSKGNKVKALALTNQFRMHPDICSFVSNAFYDGILKTAPSVTKESKASSPLINKGSALTFVNVPISRGAESFSSSKTRMAEVEIICHDLRQILDIDTNATIGIITFYSAQVNLLQQKIDSLLNDDEKANVEIGSVDAFQGKEFDYVLLSCVRSNLPKKDSKPVVGFLAKENRLCVAFSRSIRQLVVYGDVNTLKQIPCFENLYNICTSNQGGYYRES